MEHATDRGRRKTAQSTVHEQSDFSKFHGKLKLVDGFGTKFNEVVSLARVSLHRGPVLINYMNRRAPCLSSNTTSGAICDRLVDMVIVFFGWILSTCSKCAKSFAEPVFFAARIRSGGAIDR